MAVPPSASLRVRGLAQLQRDLGKVEKGMRREIRAEIKGVAEIVATEARVVALRKELYDRGGLIRGIKAGARANVGYITSRAKRDGFPYPSVYEYGGRGVTPYGPRAFLNPAADNKRTAVVEAFEDLLDRLTGQAGLGRGGTP